MSENDNYFSHSAGNWIKINLILFAFFILSSYFFRFSTISPNVPAHLIGKPQVCGWAGMWVKEAWEWAKRMT